MVLYMVFLYLSNSHPNASRRGGSTDWGCAVGLFVRLFTLYLFEVYFPSSVGMPDYIGLPWVNGGTLSGVFIIGLGLSGKKTFS